MKSLTELSSSLFLSLPILLATAPLAGAQFVIAEDEGTHLLGFCDGEITPDGRYGVLRETTAYTKARVYDLATGALAAEVQATGTAWTGVAEDAVAVTDARAAVIGTTLQILDLTNLATQPLLAEFDVGYRPRDLAITPDGSLLVVRGGQTWMSLTGGLYIFDVVAGTSLAYAPGEPPEYPSSRHSFDVDSVAVTDQHAVCTSVQYVGSKSYTRVTIWDLHPSGGGAPQIVFETDQASRTDQLGGPHDLAITPDGMHCAVRSELSIACYSLNQSASTQLWYSRLAGDPGPFGDCALDSVEITNDRIATISRLSNPAHGIGAQVDVFNIAGEQKFERIGGDPHDLAIDETGTRLVVRTHTGVYLYDLTSWPAGSAIAYIDAVWPATATSTSYTAGMDSVAMSGSRVVTLFPVSSQTEVFLFDFAGGTLVEVGHHTMADRSTDVAIAPSGSFCAVSGLSSVDIIDLHTGLVPLAHDSYVAGYWPWCDGVAIDDDHVMAFGVGNPNFSGWVTFIDLFSASSNYCSTAPNSVGPGGHLYATGSPSVGTNDLELWAVDLPPGEFGWFYYGNQTAAVPFGNGTLCVGGSRYFFRPNETGAGGVASQAIDYTAPPASGGTIQPGSTWLFQYQYRDRAGGGAQFNLTEGLEIVFGS